MKTIFNWITNDWTRVKNHCRTTDNKDFTENEASDTFKRKLLISERGENKMKWKFEKFIGDMAIYAICPKCNFQYGCGDWFEKEIIKEYNYCPNCGKEIDWSN